MQGAEPLRELRFERVVGLAEGDAVLGGGAGGAFDSKWATCPTIVVEGAIHRMWYSSWFTAGFGPTGIGLATSADGVRWKRANEGQPVLTPGAAGAFDSACVMGPEVHFDGRRHLMWYTGATGTKHASGFFAYRIGVASSRDGTVWTRENGGRPVLDPGPAGSPDEVQAATPSVVHEKDGYRMWYAAWAPKPNHTICVARSADGIAWERENGGRSVEGLNPATAFGSAVCKAGDGYLMLYMSLDPTRAIYAAQSDDGLRWRMLNDGRPVIVPSGAGYDRDIVGHPFLRSDDGRLRAWVTGYDRRQGGVGNWRLSIGLAASMELAAAESQAKTFLKSETFDPESFRDWEGHNNRLTPETALIVKQDFGYSTTHFAGQAKGELGGRIVRAMTPASYAAKIAPKTLDDKLTASGSFAITASQPGAGVFFGYFNAQQPGGSGRPIGSLGLNLDFEGKGGRLAVRLITGGNKSCGTFITPYLPGKFRPTPLKNDGTRYHWTMSYDPQANNGDGRFTFTLRSDTHTTEDYGPLPEASQKEAQARFPNTTTFSVDLPPGYKKEGTTFDRFGLANGTKAGGAVTIYFDDLRFDGQGEDFSKDPGWVGAGNRVTYEDREQVGAHDFGFSPQTSHAGGKPGEVGGGLWRSGKYGYYADRVGPLNLEQRLEARGKVKLIAAGPDSDICLGWFSSTAKDQEPSEAGNFVGVHIGGPTRVGHYFIPRFATAKGTKGKVDQGPVLTPGKLFDWSLIYDPAANDGHGEMRVTLGKESVTLALKPGQKAQGASLDRFGLFTSTAGGQMVKIYLDDLKYTAACP